SAMLRANTSVSRRARIVATTDNSSTDSVVVLMPPAVPPGDPPMNISVMSTNCDALLSSLIGTELNPAVRAVVDMNAASAIVLARPVAVPGSGMVSGSTALPVGYQ